VLKLLALDSLPASTQNSINDLFFTAPYSQLTTNQVIVLYQLSQINCVEPAMKNMPELSILGRNCTSWEDGRVGPVIKPMLPLYLLDVLELGCEKYRLSASVPGRNADV
jgi:hypothetical protein